MKIIALILILFSFSFSSYSQRITKDMSEADYYLQKSKKQKTAAWLLLSGGTVVCVSGYVLFIYEGIQGEGIHGTKAKIGLAMFYGGGISVIGSIPLFIASARNKGIAMSGAIGLKMENNISQQQPSFVKTSYPAVSFKINFR